MANKNKPYSITTKRYHRNLVITGIVLVVLIAIIGFVVATNALKSGDDVPVVPFAPTVSTTPDTIEVQEEAETLNTPQEACNFIASYYKALADQDVKALKDLGAAGAANALTRNWLSDINYKVDISKLEHPDATAFPASQGLYAGCTLYKISDFYSTSTDEAIDSYVYGKQGASGWIYYDPINVRWVIADPTIPTAYAAPTANTVERLSEDKKASVTMTSAGVYANSWWAWAYCDIQLINNSQDIPVTVVPAKYDEGFTINIPDNIRNGAIPATAETRTEVKGGCTMWRGNVSNWGIEKIGAKALEVDGNICPVVVSFGNENISPIFTVGKADATELAEELAAAQIEDYGAIALPAGSVDEDTEDAQSSENANASTRSNDNANTNRNANQNR